MENSPFLLIERLVLRGLKKTYEARFEKGLNLIWGDMDSGKSSILNLIDYCFGGSNATLQYAELTSNARTAFLQANLNGTVVTIERDLGETRAPVRVYSGPYEAIDSVFPRFMGASSNDRASDGWLSDFLLECLGIPRIQIKESKREDSDSDRLSFRDLMKLMYLRQTRVGSDNLLDYGNPAVFNKNVEVQKFVYNIHSELLTQLKGQLADESKARNALESERNAIRNFLYGIDVMVEGDSTIGERIENRRLELAAIEQDIAALKGSFSLTSRVATEMKKALATRRADLESVTRSIASVERKQENFLRLRATYKFDLDALRVAEHAHKVLGDMRAAQEPIACPLCSSQIRADLVSAAPEQLERETKSLKNRIAGLEEAIERTRDERFEFAQTQSVISSELEQETTAFDSQHIVEISGLVKSIELAEKLRAEKFIELSELKKTEAVVHRFEDIETDLDNKAATIEKLRRSIKHAEDGVVEYDDVIRSLSERFAGYMGLSGLKNVNGAYLDKRFVPFFRGISYYQTSSGGVRTIASIGSYLIRLSYLLRHGGQLPSLLLIDTPGQNIGRYKRVEDSEATDPAVYEKIYEQIISVIDEATARGLTCQVIMVDNDLPSVLSENKNFHLVKRFSKASSDQERGLIDDATAS